MNLDDIIFKYRQLAYKLFKYNDSEGNSIKVAFIFDSQSDYLDKYLSFYKSLPNFTELIVLASDGTFRVTNNGIDYFIRHNHQDIFEDRNGNIRGISKSITRQVRNNLIMRINDLINSRSFDDILQIVNESKIPGFGELSVYDTSLRLASYKNLEPDKVYLHAGARTGFEILESKGYIEIGMSRKRFLHKHELPMQFQAGLKMYEVENLACLYKDDFKLLEQLQLNP
ncbi:hypothetical protein [Dyadobacter luticola]|uniref:Uncharacterized protein n=1 Tax=Dyadobacter luticola TaxID=1979387 RepID=A0A5R9KWK2_9BACT|nr:hypothetical protein [Dyadobacter luticola]TLV00666.1 hypothetical protein FEN17_14380 [Dyadobacter luticola]